MAQVSGGKGYPDKATFEAELDRLTGVYLKLKVAAQKQGIEIETAARQAAEAGTLTPEDYEMIRLMLSGDLGQTSK
ncbi:hypothetical protein JMJ56_31475 [Belnapia sp. T18]|uniref:Uncharacterized protein n=1 Tax=Belnapia arida TaxID=2804533 RepID=A0ABS1UCR8_9PROT|nr:hypothetical protein [Belnapia arida]MBL6082489.1 hypothetical protein [Belnapia arida]